MTVKQYYQCRLRQGTSETIGWIEARGAKVGSYVELLPDAEFWHVVEVYSHGLPEDMLKEQQKLNRKSLASIEPMAPSKVVGKIS